MHVGAHSGSHLRLHGVHAGQRGFEWKHQLPSFVRPAKLAERPQGVSPADSLTLQLCLQPDAMVCFKQDPAEPGGRYCVARFPLRAACIWVWEEGSETGVALAQVDWQQRCRLSQGRNGHRQTSFPESVVWFFTCHLSLAHSLCAAGRRHGLVGSRLEDAYAVQARVGEGAFAEVFVAQSRDVDSEYVAVKVAKLDSGVAFFDICEIDILRRLSHPNLLAFRGIFVQNNQIKLVTEFVCGGTLATYIQDVGTMAELPLSGVAFQLMDGLFYLHVRHIIHRDLKPENVLVEFLAAEGRVENDGAPHVVIADFGLAVMEWDQEGMKQQCGSAGFVAPEVLRNQRYGPQVDIFAAGCILHYLLLGYQPFQGRDDHAVLVATLTTHIDLLSPDSFTARHASQACREFITFCLHREARWRLTAAAALEHPFPCGAYRESWADRGGVPFLSMCLTEHDILSGRLEMDLSDSECDKVHKARPTKGLLPGSQSPSPFGAVYDIKSTADESAPHSTVDYERDVQLMDDTRSAGMRWVSGDFCPTRPGRADVLGDGSPASRVSHSSQRSISSRVIGGIARKLVGSKSISSSARSRQEERSLRTLCSSDGSQSSEGGETSEVASAALAHLRTSVVKNSPLRTAGDSSPVSMASASAQSNLPRGLARRIKDARNQSLSDYRSRDFVEPHVDSSMSIRGSGRTDLNDRSFRRDDSDADFSDSRDSRALQPPEHSGDFGAWSDDARPRKPPTSSGRRRAGGRSLLVPPGTPHIDVERRRSVDISSASSRSAKRPFEVGPHPSTADVPVRGAWQELAPLGKPDTRWARLKDAPWAQ